MGFLNTDSMPRLVEKLSDGDNIKITENSKGSRVGTVIKKIVEKADDVTKAVEQEVVNDSYSFKIGTGDVDVSADVEDGFGEVGIKGVTYQNLAPKGVALCDDASKFTHNYFHVTVTQQNGFVQCVTNQEGYCVLGYDNSHYNNLIQPNKCYITLAEVEIIKDTSNEGIHVAIPSHISYKEKKLQGEITKGVIAKAFKTNSDVTTNNNGWLAIRLTNNSTSVGDGFKCYYVSLFEISEAEFNNLSIDELIERYNYKCEGIVGVGDESKNLFNGKLEEGQLDSTTGLVVDFNGRCRSVDYIEVNKNTDYRIQIKNTETSSPWTTVFLYDSNKKYISYTQDSNGASNLTFNTGDAKYIKFKVNVKVSSITEVQIKKGNSDTPYEPYYDGHKIEILSNGKNLFDIQRYLSDNENSQYYKISADGRLEILKLDGRSSFKNLDSGISVKRNTAYSIKCSLPWDSLRVLTQKNNVWSNIKPTNYQFYSGDSDMIYIKFVENENFPKVVTHIQVEESSTPSSYQPYFADKTQILLDEPLMRLPNGICDEITRDGKLIRKIKKIKVNRKTLKNNVSVWDFPEDISKNYIRFYRYVKDMELNGIRFVNSVWKSGYCNIIGDNSNGYRQEKEAFGVTGGALGYLSFSIKAEKIPNFDFNNYSSISNQELILDYLEKVDMTVYFEMETPLITDIAPPSLRIFKDGHLTFNTLVAPESTHVVQINKSAQIERSIREVQGLDSRVGQLESFYDDMMLETSHKLNLLTYDFEYTKESEDI